MSRAGIVAVISIITGVFAKPPQSLLATMPPLPWIAAQVIALEEEQHLQQMAAAFVVLAVEEGHQRRAALRAETRQYLTRPELLPDPRHDTPWQRLYASKSDRAFITTMGFDVATFEYMLEPFRQEWDSTAIPRTDTNTAGEPRLYRRSLDAAGALGLVLHYLNSTMNDISLGLIFALIPSTISRYRDFGLDILLLALQISIPEGTVAYPREQAEFAALSDAINARHPLLEGCFGTLDGMKTPIRESSNPEIENMNYNGWLHDHYVSSVFLFDALGS
jgi:hypothetical protein